jgi:hypothetical protein
MANCLSDKEIDDATKTRELLHSIFLELSKQNRILMGEEDEDNKKQS